MTFFLPATPLRLNLPSFVLGKLKSGALSPTSTAAARLVMPASESARTIAGIKLRLFIKPPVSRGLVKAVYKAGRREIPGTRLIASMGENCGKREPGKYKYLQPRPWGAFPPTAFP